MNSSGPSGGTLATMFEMFNPKVKPAKSKLFCHPKLLLPNGTISEYKTTDSLYILNYST